jgi:hypothetical protein
VLRAPRRKVLTARSFGQNKRMFSLAELSGILRVASKYLINDVRAEIVGYLQTLFPTNITDYRSIEPMATIDPLVAVDISREFDIPAILPAALYMSSRLSVSNIVLAPSRRISGSTRDDALLFLDALQKHLRRDVFLSAWFPLINDCAQYADDPLFCPGFSGEQTLRLAARYLEPSTDIFAIDPCDLDIPEAACEGCVAQRGKIDRDAYQPLLWELLPVLVPGREWHGWTDVENAQAKATKPWSPAR